MRIPAIEPDQAGIQYELPPIAVGPVIVSRNRADDVEYLVLVLGDEVLRVFQELVLEFLRTQREVGFDQQKRLDGARVLAFWRGWRAGTWVWLFVAFPWLRIRLGRGLSPTPAENEQRKNQDNAHQLRA